MPYGRGGAGNIQAAIQEKERIEEDLEANGSVEGTSTTASPTNVSLLEAQYYAHAGRGGAGNFHTSSDFQKDDVSNESKDSESAEDQRNGSSGAVGRGGAGNHHFAATRAKAAAAVEKAKEVFTREKISHNAEKDANDQLAMPQQAKLKR